MTNRHERRKQTKGTKASGAATSAAVAERIGNVVALLRSGQIDHAERLCHEALRIDRRHPDAHHLLGFIALQRGDADGAVACVRRAIAVAPDFVEAHNTLGAAFAHLGRHADAVESYKRSLRLRPDYPPTLGNLGIALVELDRFDEAEAAHRRAVELDPAAPVAHTNLGNTLRAAGRLEEAAAAHRQAIALDPRSAAGHNNLALVLHELERLEEAEAAFRQTLALQPNHSRAWSNLGTLLYDQQRFDEAADAHRRAIGLDPRYAEARSNLGLALQALGNMTGAANAYREAIAIDPRFASSALNLGIVLRHGETEVVVAALEQAIRAEPTNVTILYNLGLMLHWLGRLTDAVTYYRQAVAVDPSNANAWSGLAEVSLWSGRLEESMASHLRATELAPEIPAMLSARLISLQYGPGVTAAALLREHRIWDTRFGRVPVPVPTNRRDPEKPLRVGFVSADFARHPVGFFVLKLLENHDSRAFIAVGYSVDRSPDAITERLQAAADEWHEIRNETDAGLFERIRSDGIDILFDMAGHTSQNRLSCFACKPAPIQISWAGYVGTTGLTAMDYLLADRHHVPAGEEAHYGERVLRMPNGYICYAPPDDAPDVAPPPSKANGFVTFGCFNNPAKINDPLLDAWAEILGRLPGSRLFLKYQEMDDPITRQRVIERLEEHRIESARLTFEARSPHTELLAAYGRVDVALDTFPYAGGLTTCEALWMGVPVVTVTGATFAGRHSTSHLSNVGLTETIAADVPGYVATAVSLANDLDRLADLRATLRERMAASPLCDGPRFARDFEAVMRGIWQTYCAEGRPETA
ncbi:tetratricopeptide repeat protein [Shumkonia mesophila]|uniref:tetratricopeptide repeat protein n=1 Tax=Shumkonia mesophila TaxID=2838854 RepID=UPI0029346210|nr:tetratricopeptide repeat protein [Shumkonia mesophila]